MLIHETGTCRLDAAGARHRHLARGFTHLALLGVLIVLVLAAALAAPALFSRRGPAERGLEPLLATARGAAAARGETLYLRIGPSGDWRLEAASTGAGTVDSGHVEPFPGLPFTLIVSPIGTCGFDARSAAAAALIRLDPMSCELQPT